jgi:acetyl esterase/lipase
MALWSSNRKAPGGLGDVAVLKARIEQLLLFGSPPAGLRFEPGQLGPIQGEWTRGTGSGRLLLYFHGGFFLAGSPHTHRGLIGKLAEAGEADAFAVRYRLAPDCPFPASVRDGIDAYRALIAGGVAPSQVVLAGDGSGGGLAFSVGLAIRNAGLAMPAGIVAMSPWADLSLSGWALIDNQAADSVLAWELLFRSARHYLKKVNPADPYASPAFANLKEFPPIMVHAGSRELLRDDASKLGDRAADAGVGVSVEIYEGMGHLFQAGPGSEAKVSLARLGQFIKNKTAQNS